MAILIIVIVVFFILCFIIGGAQKSDTKQHLHNLNELEENLSNKNFKTSKKIEYINMLSNLPSIQLNVDTEHKKIAFCKIFPYQSLNIFDFKDIIECEIIEDSNTILKGGVGRAVVGGAIAGGVGAIVGANTRDSKNVINNLQIRIVTKDITNALYTIDLITTETKKENMLYKNSMKFANSIYATLQSIMNENSNNSNKEDNLLEQIEKLQKLKESGAISETEFEESKQRILSKL